MLAPDTHASVAAFGELRRRNQFLQTFVDVGEELLAARRRPEEYVNGKASELLDRARHCAVGLGVVFDQQPIVDGAMALALMGFQRNFSALALGPQLRVITPTEHSGLIQSAQLVLARLDEANSALAKVGTVPAEVIEEVKSHQDQNPSIALLQRIAGGDFDYHTLLLESEGTLVPAVDRLVRTLPTMEPSSAAAALVPLAKLPLAQNGVDPAAIIQIDMIRAAADALGFVEDSHGCMFLGISARDSVDALIDRLGPEYADKEELQAALAGVIDAHEELVRQQELVKQDRDYLIALEDRESATASIQRFFARGSEKEASQALREARAELREAEQILKVELLGRAKEGVSLAEELAVREKLAAAGLRSTVAAETDAKFKLAPDAPLAAVVEQFAALRKAQGLLACSALLVDAREYVNSSIGATTNLADFPHHTRQLEVIHEGLDVLGKQHIALGGASCEDAKLSKSLAGSRLEGLSQMARVINDLNNQLLEAMPRLFARRAGEFYGEVLQQAQAQLEKLIGAAIPADATANELREVAAGIGESKAMKADLPAAFLRAFSMPETEAVAASADVTKDFLGLDLSVSGMETLAGRGMHGMLQGLNVLMNNAFTRADFSYLMPESCVSGIGSNGTLPMMGLRFKGFAAFDKAAAPDTETASFRALLSAAKRYLEERLSEQVIAKAAQSGSPLHENSRVIVESA